MRINNITPVSFGYSKKSQEYLEQNAARIQEPELRDALLLCSDTCNKMEDVIRANEKKYGPMYSISNYVDFFVALKDTLLSHIVLLFDDSDNYIQSEYSYYSSALNRCKNSEDNWRASVIDRLKLWNSNLGKTKEEMQVELEESRQYAEIGKATFMEAFQDTPDDMAKATSTDTAPVIETLAKTEFSPKGMQDVMGMDSLKKELIENIIEPVNNPQQAKLDFEEYGKRIPSGILLYGPPGCGKTYIIEALAAETDSKVYVINSGNTGSKYVNQTANNIKNAFDTVFTEGDKSEKPVFIFMDEIDAMTSNRDESSNGEDTKAVATLLKCIESAKAHNTIVIGATNKYDLMDPAIRRRFDMKRYVGLPEQEHREALIRNNLSAKTKGKKILGEDEKIKSIAQSLQGYSSSSINIIANLAALNALDRGRTDIDICDFKKAIETTGEEKIDEKPYKPMAKKDKIGFATSFFND